MNATMARLRLVVIVLGILLASSANARVFPDHAFNLFPGAPDDWNTTIVKRQSGSDVTNPSNCFTPCAPGSCGGDACMKKRALDHFKDLNSSDFATLSRRELVKRYLSLPTSAGGISNYLTAQGTDPNINLICPAMNTPQYGFSFCVQQQLSTAPLNDNNQWTAGTANTELVGCTVLVVASSRGVYMCHFWEDINYLPVQYAEYRELQGFQPVLDLVQSGTPSQYAAGPGLNVNLFNGQYDNTWAFIMTPRDRDNSDDPNSQEYPNQYNQLVGLLRQLLPGIGIVNYNYDTIRTVPNPDHPDDPGENNYEFAYQGVALYVYDPNADNKGNANWRTWFEASSEDGRKLGQNPPNGNPNS